MEENMKNRIKAGAKKFIDDGFGEIINELAEEDTQTKEEYKDPCEPDCCKHKYHCGTCNTAVFYSPRNYASRPYDIPNICRVCHPDNMTVTQTPVHIDKSTPPEERDWKERFTKIMLEYLDYVNLKHSALHNRPGTELSYPEFHKFTDFIAQEIRKGQEEVLRKYNTFEGDFPEFVESLGIDITNKEE